MHITAELTAYWLAVLIVYAIMWSFYAEGHIYAIWQAYVVRGIYH